MCEGLDMKELMSGKNLTLAAGAMQAVGSLVTGAQGGKYLEYQSSQNLADAQAEREMGQVRAGRVRKEGRLVSGQATAALGASGSKVDSGSGQAVQEYILQSSEYDAMQEIYGGVRRGRALEGAASGYRAQAGNARSEGYAAAGSSLLSAAGRSREAQNATDKWIRKRLQDQIDSPQYSLDNPQYG